ncbi:HGGxSTG domain-containing protein [Novosphingobium sp.]|uniref:HGGxSTG domain-containing protein n=1 Tax=Novosphingobium sp. TaxID=1874826 RepID=UPI003B51DF1C
MGRHSKGVATFWAQIHEGIARQRQFDAWAADLDDDNKRTLFKVHARKQQEAIDAGRIYIPKRPAYLRGLTCGAIKRDGESCGMTALCANGRCVWHGGKSTGPRTTEGRARALENLKLGRQKRGKSRAD